MTNIIAALVFIHYFNISLPDLKYIRMKNNKQIVTILPKKKKVPKNNIVSILPRKIIHKDNNINYKLFSWVRKLTDKNISNNELKKIINSVFEHADNPLLVLAVIATESNFNKNAVSSKKATGLMQVMRFWAKTDTMKQKFNISSYHDLFNIKKNVQAGNYILMKYIKKENSMRKGLIKYVNNDSSYAQKVLSRYNHLKSLTDSYYVASY